VSIVISQLVILGFVREHLEGRWQLLKRAGDLLVVGVVQLLGGPVVVLVLVVEAVVVVVVVLVAAVEEEEVLIVHHSAVQHSKEQPLQQHSPPPDPKDPADQAAEQLLPVKTVETKATVASWPEEMTTKVNTTTTMTTMMQLMRLTFLTMRKGGNTRHAGTWRKMKMPELLLLLEVEAEHPLFPPVINIPTTISTNSNITLLQQTPKVSHPYLSWLPTHTRPQQPPPSLLSQASSHTLTPTKVK
jgi:hypothetical protein